MTGPAPFAYVTFSMYDAQEHLLSVRDANNKTTTMTYYADGRLHTVTTPLGKMTTHTYDDTLRTTTIVDPLGYTTVLTFDTMGRLVSRLDPRSNLTSYGYDNLGRRRWEQHPDLTMRSWQYDCCGLSGETDELGRTIEYARNPLHEVTSVRNRPVPLDPSKDSVLVTYQYNAAGRRDSMEDALERQTGYAYDSRGWLTDTTFPDGTYETVAYYKDHTIKTKTDRMRRTTLLEYDLAGRLLTKTYPDSTTATYAYDEVGRMTAATAGQTSVAFTYTPTGQMETVTEMLFGISKTFRYQYFDDGRQQWWRDESVVPNKTTTNTYFDNGLLHTITDGDNQTFTFEYWPDGALKKKTYPNGAYTDYLYNSRGWLRSIYHRKDANNLLAKYVFTNGATDWYDAVGNRTQMDITSEHHNYVYDANNLDRLLNADRPGTTSDESYTYNPLGNRLTSRQYTNWTYDAQNDELAAYDGVSYTYDGNGNRLTKTDAAGLSTYTYDYENRLVRVDLPGGQFVEFAYDALGRRVKKRNADGTVRLYWYSNEDIVVETDGAGVVKARYTHGPGVDNVLKMRVGTTSSYYHEDALGSIGVISNASRNSVRSYKYDAFGNVLSQTGSLANFYMYTAREWDADSALYYYRARHYDPKVGRFLQGDPIGPRPEEMNAYVYVGSNPVNRLDPSGLALIYNGSNTGIPYKPENVNYEKPSICAPHSSCNVDGVYSPPGAGQQCPLKIPDNCVAYIGSSGKAYVVCIYIGSWINSDPETLGPIMLETPNFQNWPNPFAGRYWP